MNIRFGFAVNDANQFEKKHFGDAQKFILYELVNGKLKWLTEVINSAREIDKDMGHGSKNKAIAIINLMKEQEVQVMVAQQFGKNIGRIVAHFVPVVIQADNIADAHLQLAPHLTNIQEEVFNKTDGTYKPFILKK